MQMLDGAGMKRLPKTSGEYLLDRAMENAKIIHVIGKSRRFGRKTPLGGCKTNST